MTNQQTNKPNKTNRHNQPTTTTSGKVDSQTPPVPTTLPRNNLEKKKQLRCVEDHICELLFLLSDLLHSVPSREDALWLARRCLLPDAALFSSVRPGGTSSSTSSSTNPNTDANERSVPSMPPRSLVDFLVQEVLLPLNVTVGSTAADDAVVFDGEGEGVNSQEGSGMQEFSSPDQPTLWLLITTASFIHSPTTLTYSDTSLNYSYFFLLHLFPPPTRTSPPPGRTIEVDFPTACRSAAVHLLVSLLSVSEPASSQKVHVDSLITFITSTATTAKAVASQPLVEGPTQQVEIKTSMGGRAARALLDEVVLPDADLMTAVLTVIRDNMHILVNAPTSTTTPASSPTSPSSSSTITYQIKT